MSTEQDKSKQLFFTFDKNFQEKIVQAMLLDRRWASQFSEVLDVNYFEHQNLKLIADRYIGYYKKYKEFPSKELLLSLLVDDLKSNKDVILKTQVQGFLVKVAKNEDLGDLSYVKERALEFCRKQGLQNALEECVELIVHENYDKVSDVIRNALAAGTSTLPGLSLHDDIDARYSETYRRTIPTGIPELDKREILNGGLAGGELGVVVAPTGVGKTHCLVNFAANALKHGKNVLFYTFELNERIVGIRVDSNVMDIPSTYCFEHIEEIKQHYKNHKEYGKLIVKYYPTSTCTVEMIRNHMDRLASTGFVADLIVIDYAGIMRSSEKYEAPRFELKKIFEELRGFAGEIDVPVWTAVQSNKEGANADVVGLENMAESYGQAAVADFVVGISRKPNMKSTGYGTLFIAKNRAGIDGIQLNIHLDTSKSRLRVLTEEESAMFADNSSDNKGRKNSSEFPDSAIFGIQQAFKAVQNRKEQQKQLGVKIDKLG